VSRSRRNHTATFKAKVAIAAIKGDQAIAELAKRFDVHPNSIVQWKSQLLERAVEAFGGEGPKASGPDRSHRQPTRLRRLRSRRNHLSRVGERRASCDARHPGVALRFTTAIARRPRRSASPLDPGDLKPGVALQPPLISRAISGSSTDSVARYRRSIKRCA
jgi:transposase-like protein